MTKYSRSGDTIAAVLMSFSSFGDFSNGLCAGSLDLHPVPNEKGTLNK